jgi:hypothetical protein
MSMTTQQQVDHYAKKVGSLTPNIYVCIDISKHVLNMDISDGEDDDTLRRYITDNNK